MIFKNEVEFHKKYKIVAGVDEAGRGPLAGPLVVAAVVLPAKLRIEGLNDSKKLSEKKRELLFHQIIEKASYYKIVEISPEKIDELNILWATMYGMERSVLELDCEVDFCLIDGNRVPNGLQEFSEAMVKGDGRFASIAAASILAKVTRDRIMLRLHDEFPVYNFAKNKGYPTKEHVAALNRYGITPHHRKSYKPVQQLSFDF